MTFDEFVSQYNGVENVGDTPENKSQCVGLIEVYIDTLGLPHVWGNACDLLANADSASFIVVANSPTNAPSEGDIVVWGKVFNGTYGHTGIATKRCSDAILEVFEQNDPLGSSPHIKTYNYDSVSGWLHPRILSGTQTNEIIPTVEQVQEQLKSQIDATTSCLTQLKQAQDQATALQSQLATQTSKTEDLTKQLTDLQLKYDVESTKNIALNEANKTISGENQDNGQKALDAEHLVSALQSYLYSIADKLGIVRTGLQDADITEKCLSELDGMVTMEKQQADAITKLKQNPTQSVSTPTRWQRFMSWFVT